MRKEKAAAEKIKSTVREKYGQIATAPQKTSCCGMESGKTATSSCCGAEEFHDTETSCCGTEEAQEPKTSCCGGKKNQGFSYSFIGEDYAQLPGYNPDADLGLGCGLPTELALIREGDTVVDLGSGAGNDVFVARRAVGEKGRVIGVDMTPEMVEKAKANNRKLGFKNVEFIPGEIEALPVADNTADVAISNCVLNLVPDKQKAFREIFRVLKPGGHFNVSDIVLDGELPEKLRSEAELYVGCVAGAVQRGDYLKFIQQAGFADVKIQKERKVEVPREVLLKYLKEAEIRELEQKGVGIASVTVWGKKPKG